MSGIFALLNTDEERVNQIIIKEQFNKGNKQGPEYSKLDYSFFKIILGVHTASISDLKQPIVFNDIVLICNGEIYNYKKLYNLMNVTPTTVSSCEVIIHLFIRYGIEQTLVMLDGVYSFVLYDFRINANIISNVYIARDPFGVRPLYKLYNSNHNNNQHNLYGVATELKCLEYFYNCNTTHYCVKQFEPGTYSIFEYGSEVRTLWKPVIENKPYFIPTFSYTEFGFEEFKLFNEDIFFNISKYLNFAVIKRCDTIECPVACLLNGGIDCSLIASLVSNYFRKKGIQIETYSIGLKSSEDIKYAKIVADYIGSKHTEIIITESDMFNAIPEVIKSIESYDTTTVRTSIENYLIGKYIASNSDAKVIFNGDGSDELFGGYLYMYKCPDDIEFDKETRRLLKDVHLFDGLRSDKTISSNGLESRTPFLDKSFVNYILSIPSYFRNHNNFNQQDKSLLRKSFSRIYFCDNNGKEILPDKILQRKKATVRDNLNNQTRTPFTNIQDLIVNHYDKHNPRDEVYKPSIELEKRYYKEIFDREFPNCQHILPYFWMPKYTNDMTTKVYNKND
jgi:asparagine synthase (glutamine-hydrolysing)